MTPEERQLISGLFDRMRSYGAPDKDRDAEALINQWVRANPDATYMLVQSVLVQEQALEAANDRVQELEDAAARMEGRGDARPRARSGGFLGGVWGGGRRARSRDPACRRSARAQRRRPTRAAPWSQGGAVHPSQRRPSSRRPARRRRLHEVGAGDGGRRRRRHAAGRQHPQHAGWRCAREPVALAGPRDEPIRDTWTSATTIPAPIPHDDAGNDPGFDSGGGDDDIEI